MEPKPRQVYRLRRSSAAKETNNLLGRVLEAVASDYVGDQANPADNMKHIFMSLASRCANRDAYSPTHEELAEIVLECVKHDMPDSKLQKTLETIIREQEKKEQKKGVSFYHH